MKTDNRQHIFFVLGIALLLLGLYNGLRFALPFEVINPYEYFHGAERTHFQILNMFISGAAVPLLSIAAGFLLMNYEGARPSNIILTLGVMLFMVMISVVFFYGFDVLPGIIVMTMVAALFVRLDKKIILASFGFLFVLHLISGGLLILWSGLSSPGDVIYSSIQLMNRFSSVFGGSDYFSIIGLNLEMFMTHRLGDWFMWTLTILPWIFLGMVLSHYDTGTLNRNNTGMMIAVTAALITGGLMIKMVEVLSLGSFAATNLADNFGGPLLGAGYFMALMLISMNLPVKIRQILSAAGEKGLTAYIAFNLIMVVLFYGPGFGLYGEVSVGTMSWIVAAVYMALIGAANILSRYNIKTLEQLSVVNIKK